ncbi:MAG: WS/DGAT domain-containing protein, partial [Gammaproteobacteria bacterium]
GTAPVLDGLGLIIVVTSYLDTLSISATAAHEAAPDLERLVEDIRESFAELRAAIPAPVAAKAPGKGAKQRKSVRTS